MVHGEDVAVAAAGAVVGSEAEEADFVVVVGVGSEVAVEVAGVVEDSGVNGFKSKMVLVSTSTHQDQSATVWVWNMYKRYFEGMC